MHTLEDFWQRVDIKNNNSCWEWLGKPISSGYGQLEFKGIRYLAHRLAWILINGEIENGLQVLHDPDICSNKLCCNPSHLRLGTIAENHQDSDFAKLTRDQVQEIRALYSTNNYSLAELASIFGVHFTNISAIVNWRSWK